VASVGEHQGGRWLHLEKVKVGGGFSWEPSSLEVASVEEHQGWRSRLGKVKVGGGFGWGRSRLEVASPKKVKIGGGFIWGRSRVEVASVGRGQGWRWLWLRNIKVGGGFIWRRSRMGGGEPRGGAKGRGGGGASQATPTPTSRRSKTPKNGVFHPKPHPTPPNEEAGRAGPRFCQNLGFFGSVVGEFGSKLGQKWVEMGKNGDFPSRPPKS